MFAGMFDIIHVFVEGIACFPLSQSTFVFLAVYCDKIFKHCLEFSSVIRL